MRLKDSGRRKVKRKETRAHRTHDISIVGRRRAKEKAPRESEEFFRLLHEQRRMETTLRESEILYHTLFENTGTGMLVIDEDTTVLTVNTEFERISRYSKKEIEGKRSWTEFVAKGYLEKMKEYHDLRRIDPKKAPRTYESKLIDRQGKVVDALLTVAMIPGTKKSVVSFIDITEYKKAEKELENLARYPADNPSPILRLDKNGIILHANKASDTLLKGWGKKIGDHAPKYWSDLVVEAFGSKSSKSVEAKCDKITYLFNAVPILDSGYVNLYGRDITERKQIEEKVEDERHRLFSILEDLPALITLFARDHSIRFSNRAFRERFGNSEGRSCYMILHNRKEPCEPCPSFHVFDTGKPETWESNRSDGRTYMTYDYPFSDVDGSSMILEVSYDITERKLMEEELRKSEEKYRLVSENIPVAVYSSLPDEYSTNTFTSGRIQNLTGYSVEEYVKDPRLWSRVLHPGDREHVLNKFLEHVRNKTPIELEYRIIAKDGSVKWIRDKASPTFDDSGRVRLVTVPLLRIRPS